MTIAGFEQRQGNGPRMRRERKEGAGLSDALTKLTAVDFGRKPYSWENAAQKARGARSPRSGPALFKAHDSKAHQPNGGKYFHEHR